MAAVERRNKLQYKLLMGALKVIPMLLALCEVLNTIFDLAGIFVPWFTLIGGTSFFTLGFLYLASCVFKFCIYHRMFLHYILVNNIICGIDFIVGLPVNITTLIAIFAVNLCVFLFLILYFYRKERCCK